MSIYQGNQKVANNYYIDNTVYCVPVGTIISYTSNIVPAGFLICDGSEVSKNTYSDLYKVVGDKFGTATDTTKFKLPDLRDKFVQGANDNVGTSKDAGLPNITGKFYHDVNVKNILDGAFSYTNGSILNLANSATSTSGYVTFDASKSNSIYGNSNTVQPPAVCLTYIIKATKLSDVPIETSNVIDDNSMSEDRTWSANKIKNSTIPYVLIDTTKDINFNDYVETGYYTPNKSFSTGWFTHSILNAPTNGWLPAGGFALEVKTFDNTGNVKWFTQVLYSYVGTDNNSAPIYSRTFFYDGKNTTFSPWKRIADIDDTKISANETWSSSKINEIKQVEVDISFLKYPIQLIKNGHTVVLSYGGDTIDNVEQGKLETVGTLPEGFIPYYTAYLAPLNIGDRKIQLTLSTSGTISAYNYGSAITSVTTCRYNGTYICK